MIWHRAGAGRLFRAAPFRRSLPTWAPIIVSGSMILFIGLFCSDSSPVRTDSKFCPARIPESSRIVVPLFPQSRSPEGLLQAMFSRRPMIVNRRNFHARSSRPAARDMKASTRSRRWPKNCGYAPLPPLLPKASRPGAISICRRADRSLRASFGPGKFS